MWAEIISIIISLSEALGILDIHTSRRRQFVSTIRRAEEQLRLCHENYLSLTSHPDYSRYHDSEERGKLPWITREGLDQLKQRHQNSVVLLASILQDLVGIFRIYSPSTGKSLRRYMTSEADIHREELIGVIRPPPLEYRPGDDPYDYESAIAKLHEFIREHISPDEIY